MRYGLGMFIKSGVIQVQEEHLFETETFKSTLTYQQNPYQIISLTLKRKVTFLE